MAAVLWCVLAPALAPPHDLAPQLGLQGRDDFGRIGPKVCLLLGGCLMDGGSDYMHIYIYIHMYIYIYLCVTDIGR